VGDSEWEKVGTKIKVQGTVESDVVKAFNEIFAEEQQLAKDTDRPAPTQSDILEILLRKGIRSYRASKS